MIDYKKVTSKKLQSIIYIYKNHVKNKTGKYGQLCKFVDGKSGIILKDLNFSYHYSCNKDFSRDKVFIRRALQK